MVIPPYLQKGDTVGLVCTARKFTTAEAEPAIQLLESWGLKVVLGKTIDLDAHQLGGTDDQRAADFQDMINNPTIKAIWCARGGYGTVRMIDLIDFSTLLKHPKWIVGFSDVTVLHSHCHILGVATLHGIMPFSVPNAEQISKDSLQKSLFGERIQYQIPTTQNNKLGKASGELIGGNLSILYSLLGSDSAVDCTDKILFIEDLDEYLYHMDRMLMNFKRNNCFNNLKGLIVGGMTDMHDNAIPYGMNIEQIILDVCAPYDFPICFNFPAGHVSDNRALCFGKNVTLEITTHNSTLTFNTL